MAALQSPGLATGLDVNSIVSQLLAIEQRPLLRMAQRETEYQAEISALGNLKSALSKLQEAASALQDTSTFQAIQASSSNEEVLSASAADSTAIGSFSVVVDRLAQRHKMASAEIDPTDTFGGRAGDGLTLTVGADSFTVDLSTAMTLAQIRDAINAEENTTGASAVIVNGDNGMQTLVLTSGETGYDNRLELSYPGRIRRRDFDFATINRDQAGQLINDETELDAALTVEGVPITRGSNEISDVVDGVTLQLQGAGEAQIDLTRDTAGISDGIQALISAYNALHSEMSRLSEGELSGDRILLSIESQIRSVLNTQFSVEGSFRYVQEIGLTSTDAGDLQLDTDMLDAAIDQDLDGLSALFADSEKGFATRLDNLLDGIVQSDGLIDSRVDGLNDQIAGLETQRGALERRLELTEQRLRAQFTALDQLVGQLQSTSNFLAQQLTGLPATFNPST